MLLELGVVGSDRRPLGAPPALRRDGRDRAPPGRGGARGGAPRHRVRRRDRGRARGRGDRGRARPAGLGHPASRAARDRVRARLGDRNRADGDAGDRAGGARVRQVAPRVSGSLRRLGEARERGRAARRCRTWTALSSAALRSTSLSFEAICRAGAEADRLTLVVLVILDGWGIAPPGPGNAVELADTPVFDALWAALPARDARRVRARRSGFPPGRWGTPRSATSRSAPGASSSRTSCG